VNEPPAFPLTAQKIVALRCVALRRDAVRSVATVAAFCVARDNDQSRQCHLAPSTAGVNCLLELKMCKACNVGLKSGYRRVAERIFRLVPGILRIIHDLGCRLFDIRSINDDAKTPVADNNSA
jgi:hypothetical protein